MVSRRRLLRGTGALLLCARAGESKAEESTIALWPNQPPGGGGPSGKIWPSVNGVRTYVTIPVIQRFEPKNPNREAVLIAPGGAYQSIAIGHEGWQVAHWLNSRGYTAYVLSYRLPRQGWQAGSLAPLQDAQRAIRLVCAQESTLHLLGFSAGGHLLGMAAARPDFKSYSPVDNFDKIRPVADTIGLIYPVITLEPPYTHTSTHHIMVGENSSQQAEAYWSVQNYVTTAYPPTFLARADDDPVVKAYNILVMVRACRQHGVPVESVKIHTGGHGFGLGRPGTVAASWDKDYLAWLQAQS